MPILAIFLILIVLLFVWAIFTYNRLITLRNNAEEAWADIDVQLKRRYNLIPNLVETVKGYAIHEREVLQRVTEARTRAMGATSRRERAEAENFLSNTLKTLFAVAENYPNLKANQNFLELQRELVDAEDKIQAARRLYNSCVRDFNILRESFPANIIAKTFNFKELEYFEIAEAREKEVPKVKF